MRGKALGVRAPGLARLAVFTVILVAAPRARAEVVTLVKAGEATARACGAVAPEGWQEAAFDDKSWTRGAQPGACEVLRLRRRFDVGGDAGRLVTLTLSARYQDGFIAWLNGVQVASR